MTSSFVLLPLGELFLGILQACDSQIIEQLNHCFSMGILLGNHLSSFSGHSLWGWGSICLEVLQLDHCFPVGVLLGAAWAHYKIKNQPPLGPGAG